MTTTTLAPVVSASDLTDLHRQIDTLAMLNPDLITHVLVLVRQMNWQAMRRVNRRCPEDEGNRR